MTGIDVQFNKLYAANFCIMGIGAKRIAECFGRDRNRGYYETMDGEGGDGKVL